MAAQREMLYFIVFLVASLKAVRACLLLTTNFGRCVGDAAVRARCAGATR